MKRWWVVLGDSLRWRLAKWFFAAMLTVAALLTVYYQLRVEELLAREGDARLAGVTRHVAAVAGHEALLAASLDGVLDRRDVLAVAVYDAAGRRRGRRARPGAVVPAWGGPEERCWPCRPSETRRRWTAPVASAGRPAGGVVLEASVVSRRDQRLGLLARALTIVGVVMGLALVVTLLLSKRLTTPLLELAAATRELGRGRWGARMPERTYGEIRALAGDLQAMAASLSALDDENRSYREGLEERVEQRTRELQEALDRVQALSAEKDQFVATVSHDFRSPLAVILSCVQTVLRDDEMPPDVRARFLARAERQCRRLQTLVTDLLDLARIENRDMALETVPLGEVAREAVEAMRASYDEAGVELVLRPAEGEPAARLDRRLVVLAVSNLLGNALKFTPAGGRVVVETAATAGRAVLAVEDTGPGIPEEELAQVFDRFFQGSSGRSRADGSGLGLAIVEGVARKHDGEVAARSTVGEGTRFELQLPAA